jgi:succinoglycan biosynthesis protein ExoM
LELLKRAMSGRTGVELPRARATLDGDQFGSPPLKTTDDLDLDICVCTFQRAHIAQTLRSISTQSIENNWRLRVIVADNDVTPSAREVVEATADECGLAVTYVHAPSRNISLARNACLDASTAPLLAFIDDDELASPGWLRALVSTLVDSTADVVLGPVKAVYGPNSPQWIRRGDFHSTRPVWVHGSILTGYTSNVLFRSQAPSVAGRRFRMDLGKSGGEDTAFFSEVGWAGGRIAFAPDALITEAVVPERATLSWLLLRRFRFGETHGMLLMEHGKPGAVRKITRIVTTSAKAAACFLAASLSVPRPDRARYLMLRGIVHMGAASWLIRKSLLQG